MSGLRSKSSRVRKATVEVPEAARAVVVSLDGVMAPMHGTGGYREAGHATVSLVDGHGEPLHSVCTGPMPQACRATLQMMVATAVETVPGCFRGNRHRVGHADAKAKGLTIGSGVVEAAGKSLVTERLKRSGMRWGAHGGQAILTPRPFVQNRRFDHAWPLLAKSYRAHAACPDNVVPLRHANIPWD